MIKKYNQYINESFNGFKTIGEYIESISKDNDYALNIISQYTKDIDPTVRLANAINLLPKSTQELIVKLITDEKMDKGETNNPDVISHTIMESNSSGGKHIFQCFLKSVSALGQKNWKINWKSTKDNSLALFETDILDPEDVMSVLSRFVYFKMSLNKIGDFNTFMKLYLDIKTDGTFDYGLMSESNKFSLGSFVINKSTLNSILTSELKSAQSIKKFLVSLDLNKIKLLGEIKSAMKSFFPGTSENKSNPTINGDIISYGYQGLGKWDNNQIDGGEIENIKTNFKSFLMQYKWSDKVQFSVTPSDHWVFLNIKLK